jgi:spermidine/putrescine-binding protein
MKLKKPKHWEDLGAAGFYGLVGLADPSQSGTAAASYEMIVQSGETWEEGWAKLINILGNVKRFYAGAGDAAEAVPSGEVAVSTCIDFYGINRVSKYPDTLIYESPKGQTAFNPDPIAILKNPPHPELAQRMVNFVLSLPGQALWALPVGHPDGPIRAALCRQPIRKDVYTTYADQLSPMTINPFAEGNDMAVDNELWSMSYGVLRQLVWAAAVENLEGLKAAKKKLIEEGFHAKQMGEFNALPDNIASREKLQEIDRQLLDKKQRDIIVTEWITYFRNKYERLAE